MRGFAWIVKKAKGTLADERSEDSNQGCRGDGHGHRMETLYANLKSLVMMEIPQPITVRRTVAFPEAVYESEQEVEGVKAEHVENPADVYDAWRRSHIAVIVDPEWGFIRELKPNVVVDAIMAKRHSRTQKEEAPLVIGVGPGLRLPGMSMRW